VTPRKSRPSSSKRCVPCHSTTIQSSRFGFSISQRAPKRLSVCVVSKRETLDQIRATCPKCRKQVSLGNHCHTRHLTGNGTDATNAARVLMLDRARRRRGAPRITLEAGEHTPVDESPLGFLGTPNLCGTSTPIGSHQRAAAGQTLLRPAWSCSDCNGAPT